MRLRALLAPLLAATWLLASQGPPPALVATGLVTSGQIHPVNNLIGTLHFHAISQVASQSAGAVRTLRVNSGEQVTTGAVLAVLDSDILQANIAAKRSELARAQAGADQAKRDEARFKRLYDQNSISDQQFEQARLKAAELSDQAQMIASSLDALMLELEKRTIRSPFDGVVTARHVSVGEWVGVGGPVATVAQSDPMEVHIHVSSRDLLRLEPKQRLPVTIGQHHIEGRVAGIVPLADSASRTFLVRVALDLPAGFQAAQGMEATVGIPQPVPTDSLLLHRDAVIERFGQQVVFAVIEGKAQMMPVEILGFDGLQTAVRSATLKEGMAVITRGNERIFPGQAVRTNQP